MIPLLPGMLYLVALAMLILAWSGEWTDYGSRTIKLWLEVAACFVGLFGVFLHLWMRGVL